MARSGGGCGGGRRGDEEERQPPAALEKARERAVELQGPPISFKRSRHKLSGGGASESGGIHHPPTASGTSSSTTAVGGGGGSGTTAATVGWSPLADPHGLCPDVSSRYEKLGRIGEGTYGVVYRARDRGTGEICALKRCLPHHEQSDGFPLTTLREITALREISAVGHPGVVRLLDVAVSSSRSGVFLVFEYCEHDMGNLVDAHFAEKGRSPFREADVKTLATQLLSAVSFLHSRHIIHRDIKLSNILYNHKGQLQLADFGLSRRVGGSRVSESRNSKREEGTTEENTFSALSIIPEADSSLNNLTPKVVSLWYRPPELLLGSDDYNGEGVDNWGIGCVIGELLDGVPLMKGKNEMDQISKMFDLLGPPNPLQWPGLTEMPLIKSGSLSIPRRASACSSSASSPAALLDRFDGLSSAGIELLQNLLFYNPAARWTADRALGSRYFGDEPYPTPKELMPTFPTQHGT